jgi:hypothetical protein
MRPAPVRFLFPVLLSVLVAGPASAFWSDFASLNLVVASGAGDQVQPKVVATSDGGCWVSWYDGASGYDVRVQRYDAAGVEQFAAGGILVADRGFSSTQDYGLAVDALDGAALAFRDDRFSGTQITAARVTTSGTLVWGVNGVQLTNTTAFVASPRICGTADGGVVVAWTEDASARVQKLDGMGGTAWGPAGLTFTPATGSYSPSDLHAHGNDAILAFVYQTGGFGSPRHLYAQKFDGTGALLWPATHVKVFDGGSLQFGNFPGFEPDGSGGGVFSWYDTAASLQCYVQHVTSAGAEAFGHNGAAVSTDAVRIRVSPHADYDAVTGETFAFWTEQNSLQSQGGVYGQKFDAAGNRQWGATGKEVLPLSGDSITLVRCVPSEGGAFAFWDRAPSFGTDRLYGIHLDTAGAADIAQFDVSSAAAVKSRLDVAKTTSGMAVLAWGDQRNGSSDIYAQNVNPDGSLGVIHVAAPEVAGAATGFLGDAVPNPTAAGSDVSFAVPAGTSFALDVVDVRGRLVRRLAAGEGPRQDAARWNGRDEDGARVAAGVYFFRLSTAAGVVSEKVVTLR